MHHQFGKTALDKMTAEGDRAVRTPKCMQDYALNIAPMITPSVW